MNVLLISNGSRGDINPFISLGMALKNRGHQVTVISIDLYQQLVLDVGLNFISCGTSDDYYKGINHPDAYSLNPKKTFQVLADYMLLSTMRSVYDIVSNFDPKDTILVASGFMYGARLASEKLQYPLVTLCLQPFVVWSVTQPPIGPDGTAYHKLPYYVRKYLFSLLDHFLIDKALSQPFNLFRQELGLEKVNRIYTKWCYSPQKVIGLFPNWFASPAIDWPDNTELVGFIHYDENPDEQLSEDIQRFLAAGEKPVIFTYGTSVTQGDRFFKYGIEAARQLGLRCLVLSVHKEQLPALQSDKELYATYVPFKKLLPQCAAIVHAGGIGTIAQSLAAGLPQLIVPFVNDQPDNAFRLEKLGVSLNIPIKKWTKSRAVAGLKELLNSNEIKMNCERYSKKIDFQQAEQDLCVSIEQVSASRDIK